MKTRLKALVIDDDPSDRDSICSHLAAANVDVVPASNGFVALEIAQNGRFDFVTLDLSMPEMDGYETFCKLEKILGEFKLIIITAHISLLKQVKKLGLKPMDCFYKGHYDIPELLECVEKIRESLRAADIKEEISGQSMPLSNNVEWTAVCLLLLAAIFFLTSYLLCVIKQYVLFDPFLSLLILVACITSLSTTIVSLYTTRNIRKTKRVSEYDR